MLVLSRQRDESIIFTVGGDEIEVVIVDIRGEKVRLGIKAPPHVPVHRKEVFEAIKREKEASGKKGDEAKVQSLAVRKPDPPKDQASGLRDEVAKQNGQGVKPQ